jgi:hypothetical protein
VRALGTAAGAGLLVLAVTACGGGGGTGATGSATTGTTATSTGSSTGKATATPATVSPAVSQVKGRQHDAGTIVGYKTAGGLTVLVLDRWSVKGMSDAKLASQGVAPVPHTDDRYYDQNKGKTYTVPVTPSAPIVVNTCVKGGTGKPTMTSTPVSLSDWLNGSGRSKTIVLLTYDASGRLTRLDTDPAC